MAVLPHTNGIHVVNGAQTNGASTHSVHKPSDDGFSTRAIHVGSEPSSETGAVIPAISLSTTFKQDAIGVHKVGLTFWLDPKYLICFRDTNTRAQRTRIEMHSSPCSPL